VHHVVTVVLILIKVLSTTEIQQKFTDFLWSKNIQAPTMYFTIFIHGKNKSLKCCTIHSFTININYKLFCPFTATTTNNPYTYCGLCELLNKFLQLVAMQHHIPQSYLPTTTYIKGRTCWNKRHTT
jgi:hypothetical protein